MSNSTPVALLSGLRFPELLLTRSDPPGAGDPISADMFYAGKLVDSRRSLPFFARFDPSNLWPKHSGKLRATIDGDDVTSDCFFADEAVGVVGLFDKDESGRNIPDPSADDVVKKWRYGVVRIEVLP